MLQWLLRRHKALGASPTSAAIRHLISALIRKWFCAMGLYLPSVRPEVRAMCLSAYPTVTLVVMWISFVHWSKFLCCLFWIMWCCWSSVAISVTCELCDDIYVSVSERTRTQTNEGPHACRIVTRQVNLKRSDGCVLWISQNVRVKVGPPPLRDAERETLVITKLEERRKKRRKKRKKKTIATYHFPSKDYHASHHSHLVFVSTRWSNAIRLTHE